MMADGMRWLNGLSEHDDAFKTFQHAGLFSKVAQSADAIAVHMSQRVDTGVTVSSASPHTNPKHSIEHAMNGMAMSGGQNNNRLTVISALLLPRRRRCWRRHCWRRVRRDRLLHISAISYVTAIRSP